MPDNPSPKPITLDFASRLKGIASAVKSNPASTAIQPHFNSDGAFISPAETPPPKQNIPPAFAARLKSLSPEQQELASKLYNIPEPVHIALSKFITSDPATEEMKRRVIKLAHSSCNKPVHIHGESGTGKELIANALHGCRKGPFVAINCAAFTENLIESELFGHKKGSFTGAVIDKTGLWITANNGTLFLDEIADMSLPMQAKILRALQTNRIRAVGDTVEQVVTARIVSASHKNLKQLVKTGLFREDLYWRLCIFNIYIKPLRERKNDIDEIIDSVYDIGGNEIPNNIRDMIRDLELHGNVRELDNVIENYKMFGATTVSDKLYKEQCERQHINQEYNI